MGQEQEVALTELQPLQCYGDSGIPTYLVMYEGITLHMAAMSSAQLLELTSGLHICKL